MKEFVWRFCKMGAADVAAGMVDRRLIARIVGTLVLAGLVLGGGLVGKAAADGDDDDDDLTMTVEVENATITLHVGIATFDATKSLVDFLVIGDITEVNGEEADGTFYCKGVFTDPVAAGLPPLNDGPDPDGLTFVDQRFRIVGVGSIIGGGAEFSAEPLAITGGTGHFTGVHGTYTGSGLPIPVGDGNLSFEFQVSGFGGDDDDDDDDDD